MKLVKSAKWAYIITSIALIIVGVCLMIWPDISLTSLCITCGVILAVFGIVKLVGYFSHDRFALAFQFDLALGFFALITGVLMLARPVGVVLALPVILGVFIVTDGVFKFQTAFDAKRFGLEHWWLVLLLALLTCIAGVLLLIDPFDSAAVLAIFLGASLAVDGVQNLCVVAYTVRSVKAKNGKVIDVDYKEL